MKVLLIATNQAERYMDRMVVRPLPIGVAYLAAHVDEERHALRVLDLMFSRNASADVEAAVKGFQPDVVGLSIRNLDNQSYLNPVWHLPAVKEIVQRVRAASSAVIVCGGPGFSILPGECLEFLEADLGIAGDATESFAALLDGLERTKDERPRTAPTLTLPLWRRGFFSSLRHRGRVRVGAVPLRDLPGMAYRDNGRVVVNEGRSFSAFSRPPRLDLLDLARYDRSGFGIGVVTKLAQAYSPAEGGAEGWRIRPVGEVLHEVEGLRGRFGIRKLFFIDSGFNIPLDYAKSICHALINAGLRIRWNSYLRPGDCDAELIALMKRSGCSLALMTGMGEGEELSERLDRLRRLTSLCHAQGLPFALSLSFGEPGETEPTVVQKLEFLKEASPAFATLRVGTRVLPGAALAGAALDDGLIASNADLLRPTFYIASAVRGWLANRLRLEAADHPRWNLV
jgi:hypothetical protein